MSEGTIIHLSCFNYIVPPPFPQYMELEELTKNAFFLSPLIPCIGGRGRNYVTKTTEVNNSTFGHILNACASCWELENHIMNPGEIGNSVTDYGLLLIANLFKKVKTLSFHRGCGD